MRKIKFLKAFGSNPAESIMDWSEPLQASLEVTGATEGEDFELYGNADDAAKLDAQLAQAQEAATERLAGQIAASVMSKLAPGNDGTPFPIIRGGKEPVDKDPRRGYKNLAQFARDVYLAGHGDPGPLEGAGVDIRGAHERLRVCQAAEVAARGAERAVGSDELSTTTGPYGSWLVPTEHGTKLWRDTIEQGTILQYCQPVPMSSMKIDYPAIDDSSHASSVFGGIIVYRTAELAAKTMSRPKLRQLELALHKMTVLIPVTDELLRFSVISLGPLLGDLSAAALSWYIEDEVFNGVGVGQLLGIFNSPALIAVTRNTGNRINAADVRKIWARIPGRHKAAARWYYNADCEEDLNAMATAVGTGGQLVYMPAGGLSAAPYGTLMGRPVTATEHCQAIGTAGDLVCCVPSQYVYAQWVAGIEEAVSIHLRFDYDETVFRYVLMNDGRPWWNSAFTPKRGNNTLSPFVTVAA